MGSEHKGEEYKGRAKEAAGDLTGDKDMQREGKADQAGAKAKSKVSKATDKAKGVISGDGDDRAD
jgi:uncharacterized protein YjbJ (UPF0337 family)